MIMAELDLKTAKAITALSYAKKAFQLDPNSSKIYNFIESIDLDPNSIETRLANLQKMLDGDPNNRSLQLAYVHTLIKQQ